MERSFDKTYRSHGPITNQINKDLVTGHLPQGVFAYNILATIQTFTINILPPRFFSIKTFLKYTDYCRPGFSSITLTYWNLFFRQCFCILLAWSGWKFTDALTPFIVAFVVHQKTIICLSLQFFALDLWQKSILSENIEPNPPYFLPLQN